MNNIGYAAFLSIDGGNSTGSGCRITVDGENYLATARHVLYNDDNHLRGNLLVLSCQDPRGIERNIESLSIELSSARIITNLVADIALIYLGEEDIHTPVNFIFESYVTIQNQGYIRPNSINSINTKQLSQLEIGSEIYLIGYPSSLLFEDITGFDVRTPLLRRGIIAGKYTNTFIIDCPAYYGNSGAPVIQKADDGSTNLVGIVSRYIPFAIQWRNMREALTNVEYVNSGYSVCIPLDLVFQLVQQSATPNSLNNDSTTSPESAAQQHDQSAAQQHDQPAAQQHDQPASQQHDQPASQQHDQPAGQQYDQPAGQQYDQPASQQHDQPASQQHDQPAGQQYDQPASQ